MDTYKCVGLYKAIVISINNQLRVEIWQFVMDVILE